MIKKRLAEELKYEEINDKQYKKYKIIKNNATLSVGRQKSFLSDVRTYNNLFILRHDNEISLKKKKFNELEFQVFTIKSSTIDIQKKIGDTKQEILNTNKSIKDIKIKNKKIFDEFTNNIREYLKTKIQLIYVFKSLKVKSLDDIVKKFNDQKFEYQSYYTQFININKNIAELNIDYTSLQNELNELNSAIKIKKDEITREAKAKNEYNSDENIIQIQIDIQKNNQVNNSLQEKITKNDKLIINAVKYLNTYDKELNEVIKNINMLYNQYEGRLSTLSTQEYIINRNSFRKSSNKLKKIVPVNIEEIALMNDINNNISRNSLIQQIIINYNQEWNIHSIKNLIKFLFKFQNKFFYVLSTVALNVGVEMYQDNKKEFELINIFNDKIMQNMKALIVEAMIRLENKIKILNRTDKEIFRDRKTVTEIRKR